MDSNHLNLFIFFFYSVYFIHLFFFFIHLFLFFRKIFCFTFFFLNDKFTLAFNSIFDGQNKNKMRNKKRLMNVFFLLSVMRAVLPEGYLRKMAELGICEKKTF